MGGQSASGGERRRRRRRFRRHTPPGAPPGSVVVDPEAPRPALRFLAYGPDGVAEGRLDDAEAIRPLLGSHRVLWVNVDGLGDGRTIQTIGELFALHPLALEDVVNVHQRSKVEAYGRQLFIVLRMAEPGEHFGSDQLSLFLGDDFVVTFQERAGDCFDPVRERIRKPGGRLRTSGPDYLAYSLLDAAIDGYFPVLEELGERLESLETDVLGRPRRDLAARIHSSKRDLLAMRRAVWPLREALGTLARDPHPAVGEDTRLYLRDLYDHAVQLLDLLENYRDIGSGLTDLYLTSVSNRMNEVIKVLTVISTIFMPLSFIAGVYGMNFDLDRSPLNMPELRWRWGYPFALGLMAATVAVLLGFFWRRGWLAADGGGAPEPTGSGAPEARG